MLAGPFMSAGPTPPMRREAEILAEMKHNPGKPITNWYGV